MNNFLYRSIGLSVSVCSMCVPCVSSHTHFSILSFYAPPGNAALHQGGRRKCVHAAQGVGQGRVGEKDEMIEDPHLSCVGLRDN
jgi:hypothetical protein